MPILQCDDLRKTFAGGFEAVRGITFDIDQGEAFGLLGPNGAGKTTTMRMLGTLLTPTGGRATVAGHDVVREAAAVRRAIGFAMQEAGLARYATGREHLVMMARLYGLSRAQARSRASDLLELFALEEAADRQVRTYSGGMRRRIDLACGLVHRPRLLFLDEPTTGVDPTSRAALWDELRRLQADGVSLFLTTHYLEEADRLCDRLAIVDRGVIVARGTPDELKAEVGADVVTVGLNGSEPAEAAAALQALGRVRVAGSGRSVALELTDGASAVAGIVERLRGAGIVPSTITVARPTLDDVFLRYTGATIEEHDEDAAPAGEALMRLAVESGVLFQRALREIPRVPTRIAFPVIGPVMQLILLTAVLSRVTQLPGYPARSSVQFMTAGVLSLTVLAGAGGAGFQMVQDIDTGFFDKLRVAPISRAAIVLGLLLTDATRLAVQSLIVIILALLLGAHIATGALGLLGMLALAAIFGAAWSGISLNVALRTRNPEVTAAAGVLTFPLYFGSTAFMPHDLLPSWLQWFNIFNPINYLITADRALMSSHWDWHAIGGALLTSLIVGAITMPLATRAFRRAVSG